MTFINIKSEERSPSILLFFMFFSIVAASITGATVRDAVFLIQFDKTFFEKIKDGDEVFLDKN